jgi:hypothetical protein
MERAPQRTKLENSFERHLVREGMTVGTRRTYLRLARRLLAFLGDEPLTDINDSRLETFLETVDRAAGCAVMQFVRFALGVPDPDSVRSRLELEFEEFLRQGGKSANIIDRYRRTVHRFLAFIGNEPLPKVSQDMVREFFNAIDGSPQWKRDLALIINQFMRFALVRLPAPIRKPEPTIPVPDPVRDAREIALRERWSYDRVLREKERADDLVAILGRQLINHYLFFQSRVAGARENMDEVIRLMDECRLVIEDNLQLFLKLSAMGKNLGSVINERIIR